MRRCRLLNTKNTYYDLIVIGGGPAGCAAAGQIAQKGYRVLVAEEHPVIGEPVQCAGLVSPRTLRTAGLGADLVLNRLYGAFVHAPGGECLTIRGKKERALVIDRAAFDRRIAERARGAGVEILTGARAGLGGFLPEAVNVNIGRRGREFTARARLLIGADGIGSGVAAGIRAGAPAQVVRMYAAEVELKCPEQRMARIFLGREIAPGWFGWIVPVDENHARVGVGAAGGRSKHPLLYFNKLVEAYPAFFKGMKVVRRTGGAVPIGPIPRIYAERTLLVGDAAGQVKPISGGGLYLGLTGAKLCASTAVRALSTGDLSARALAAYQELWEREMAEEIKIALAHREIYLTLSDPELNTLIGFFGHSFWQYVISRYADIDYPSLLAGKLSFARPWAEKFLAAGLQKTLGRSPEAKTKEEAFSPGF